MKKLVIYSDGACEGNPGPGGFAAVIEGLGERREIVGSDPRTTNNRMELTAVICALESVTEPARVRVVTDSQYVVLGMTQWIHTWQRKRWKSASGQPVKNQDLWSKLLELAGKHQVRWEWIRGHSGHPQNERVDRLAKRAITDMKRGKSRE
jgi:ribonuclease HI